MLSPQPRICTSGVVQVREGLTRHEGSSTLAHRLAAAAFQHSLDRSGQTPYSLGASEAFDMVYSGAGPCLLLLLLVACPKKVLNDLWVTAAWLFTCSSTAYNTLCLPLAAAHVETPRGRRPACLCSSSW